MLLANKQFDMIHKFKTFCLVALLLIVTNIATVPVHAQQPANIIAEADSNNDKGASEILSFENDSQRKIYADLILELRCPKCQNQNIADSNAEIAVDLRNKVYEMAIANKGKGEIKEFMLARYGEFVLYKPQFSGKTLLLWLGPVFLLFGVIIFVVRIIIRNAAALNTQESSD